eukprot:g26015.t1
MSGVKVNKNTPHQEDKTLKAVLRVVDALAEDPEYHGHTAPRYIPYRDSKVTRLLRPCFGGPGRAVLFGLAAEGHDAMLATLELAQRNERQHTREKLQRFVFDRETKLQEIEAEVSKLCEHLGIASPDKMQLTMEASPSEEELRLAELLQLRRRVEQFEDWQRIRQAQPHMWRSARGASGQAARLWQQGATRGYSGVIVGGGVTGCAMLYNLAKRGVKCVLFEKGELTCGATWHAAGLVTRFHGGNNFRLWHDEGVNLFSQWQAEGTPLSFHTPGSIRLIPNQRDYIDEASDSALPEEHHDTEETVSDTCGIFLRRNTSVTNAFADRAKGLGGTIEQKTEVVGLKLLPSRQWEVLTRSARGEEKRTVADFVINAAGLWCDKVGAMAGVRALSIPALGVEVLLQLTKTVVALDTNGLAAAAHQVGLRVWYFALFALDSIAVAAQGLVPVAIASSGKEKARWMSGRLLQWGGIGGTLSGILLASFAGYIPAVFTNDELVQATATPLIIVVALLQPLAGVVFTWDGLFQGLSDARIGPYEYAEAMQLAPEDWRQTGMPNEYANFLFEGDVERLMPHLERAMEVLPQVGEVGMKTVLNGPTMWPADGNHLVGPAPEWDIAPNYWLACAESYGIAHSAGLSRYLSEWIVTGEAPYELKEADPARYGAWATKDWVAKKVRETYGMNNHVHFPNENLLVGRPVEPVPNQGIYEVLKSKGCQFGFHNGWESANYFDPAMSGEQHGNSKGSFRRPIYKDSHTGSFQEYELVQDLVEKECKEMASFGGICYWPFAKYHVSGPGAVDFLDRLVPNRLPNVGRCALSYFLTPQGKISSEVMLVRLAEDKFYVELFDWRWMHMHKPSEGVEIENVTADFGTLMVSGPESRRVLGELAKDPEAWSKDNFKFYAWRQVELAGIPCRALRVSFTGELGWELHPATADVAPLYNALKEAEPRLNDWGGYAMGSFRLEKGFKAFGSDMTKDHQALEAGISGKFLRMEKDFVGRDALAANPTPAAD